MSLRANEYKITYISKDDKIQSLVLEFSSNFPEIDVKRGTSIVVSL